MSVNIRIDELKKQIADLEKASFSRPAPLNLDQTIQVLQLKIAEHRRVARLHRHHDVRPVEILKLYCVICYGCFETMKYQLICSDACHAKLEAMREAGAFKIRGLH